MLKNFRYTFFNTVVSTNDECIKQALAGDPGGLWVVASRQTGGRGRRGRVWTSEPGNLYASLLLVDSLSKQSLTLLSFAIAVAVHSLIASFLPMGADIKIKWPNDLLICRRKVSGVLIETLDLKNGLQAVIIGIGINIKSCPDNTLYPVTSLAQEGVCVDLKDVLSKLYQEIAKILAIWRRDTGRKEIMSLWRCYASGIGDAITVNLPHQSLSGRFVGIDDFGYLLLEESKGCFRQVFTGDIIE
ncbi:MAG: biotin--[acetyl-CoA-carboxylase] ligase [Candidatus Liberibacter ctenarytainae]|uniref:biotin--[biotin carboxyl-carrier protein] ligase n=1 Tax=Candidatus Liberibacter ctenarytainae TaxID=2020335 RepID=A0A937AJ74_9HYPH|nr:biotin--[acetyl-CoA-carboxylase] ligase [Candidatus Liberibacter ctenarytainae]